MERTSLVGIDCLDGMAREMRIETAVIAASEEDARQAVDKLISGGASLPPEIAVRNIDLAGELIVLSHYCDDSQNDA